MFYGIREAFLGARTAAAQMRTLVSLVDTVAEEQAPDGLFIGDMVPAWSAAADLSAQRDIRRWDRPYRRVLSCALTIYDEQWTTAYGDVHRAPACRLGAQYARA